MKAELNRQSTSKSVLVAGGRGFIGRHVVAHLERMGAQVIVGTRQVHENEPGKHPEREACLHRLVTAADCASLLDGVDVVVNAVGILRQRGSETYENVHRRGVAALARACASRGIRLVHISILGIYAPVRSEFTLSKRRGETAVRLCGGNWAIVRPSLVIGEGGFGAGWFKRVAAWPVHFTPANATGGFAPIEADRLGLAIARIALDDSQPCREEDRIFELGGERIVTVPELLAALSPSGHKAVIIRVPAVLARLVSHVCDLFDVTPFSFGHFELLKHPNYPTRNRLVHSTFDEAQAASADFV